MNELRRLGKATLAGGMVVLAYLLVLKIQTGEAFMGTVSILGAIFLFAVFFFLSYSINSDKEDEVSESEEEEK